MVIDVKSNFDFYAGALCNTFSGPSSCSTCAGEQITFTCVVNSGAASWIITPGGQDGVCSYSSVYPNEDSCGPGRRFTSSRTEESSTPLSSSLSVALSNDLNGTLVQCADATVFDSFIGSYNICVLGEF